MEYQKAPLTTGQRVRYLGKSSAWRENPHEVMLPATWPGMTATVVDACDGVDGDPECCGWNLAQNRHGVRLAIDWYDLHGFEEDGDGTPPRWEVVDDGTGGDSCDLR